MERNILITVIGLSLTGLLATFGFLKGLRNDRRIFVLTIITSMIGVLFLVLVFFGPTIHWSTSIFMFGPFIYIATYGLLRKVFKLIYKVEPTYNRRSFYDPEDKRHQNFLDLTTHLLPLILGMLGPILLKELAN
jgi:hypothetical protein